MIAIAPSRPGTIYVVSDSSVFKSVNGGADWTPADAGLRANLLSFAIDPSNNEILYIGTGEGWVYVSINGGGKWDRADEGLFGVHNIVMAVGSSGIVYAGTGSHGVFKRQIKRSEANR